MQNQPGQSQPGWYPDPAGKSRWWDGSQWGDYAIALPVPDEARSTATLTQALSLVAGFIIPLVFYFTSGEKQPFVRHHASEALNFQITVLIASLAAFVLMFVLIGFVLLPVIIIASWVFTIQAAIAANRGEWYRYPVSIRLVPGAQI